MTVITGRIGDIPVGVASRTTLVGEPISSTLMTEDGHPLVGRSIDAVHDLWASELGIGYGVIPAAV